MRVGLVFGGHTTEGEVSKLSAEGVRGALQKLKHEVIDIEFDKDIAMHIQDANVDVIFNAMHGQYGEDGCLQGLLNIMHIPYTHSGVLASALGMNKAFCKTVFKDLGIKPIRGFLVTKNELYNDTWKDKIQNSEISTCSEVFIKPVADGSSKDAFIVHDIKAHSLKTAEFETASEQFLVEERIIGREIQVAVLADKPIGMLEIIPNAEQSEFYDYKAKYTKNGAKHKPVETSEEVKKKLFDYAEKIHCTLGLNCISRSEFLLTENQEIYALEVNTNPGLTPFSIVPEIAFNAGVLYEELIETLLKNAKFGS